MKKAVLLIAIFFALGFGFKAQGQITSNRIFTLSEVLTTKTATEAEYFTLLKNGTPHKLFFSNNKEVVHGWETQGVVKVAEFESCNAFASAQKKEFLNDLSTTEMIVIKITAQDNLALLNDVVLKTPNLKYIVAKSYNLFSKSEIQSLLGNLSAGFKGEIVIETLEQPK